MVEDVLERLAFMRCEPASALVVGDRHGALAAALSARGCAVTAVSPSDFDEAQPWPFGTFEFIASLASLDTVNDLPGALIHMRGALVAGGVAIASFTGAGSLPVLRGAMLAADGERPAARLHPMVDTRAASELMQRAGFARQVVDGHRLTVRYPSLDRLVGDLRAMGLTSALASPAPPITREGLERARAAFQQAAEADGKVSESFEILTLTGWKD